ncbi:hypothetical protein niasHT_010750 [Heterodera trifolii]|uniref:LIM zinc-binding domain-containing protein n=1 Tax=Heterodera trifolii TaxID=157864 RepID=A0ABD2KV59_9BILA
MRSVKHGGKKGMRFRYKLSAVKRQNKKQKKKQRNVAGCSLIKKAWQTQLSSRQNLSAMGLVYDPNEALKKNPEFAMEMDQSEIEVIGLSEAKSLGSVKEQKKATKSKKAFPKLNKSEAESSKVVLELQQIALEGAQQMAEQKQRKRERAKLQQSDIEFCQKMLQRHGENYEGMSRDPLNIWQNTPRQIERKIGVYKRSIASQEKRRREGMPSGGDDEQQFEEAVKPALESLLSDLQKTAEVLRQGKHGKGRQQQKEDESAALLDLKKLRNSPRQRNQSPAAVANLRNGRSEELQPRRDPMLEGDKLGIHTIPKGDCASCNQAVIGPVVIALGKMWHPEHFCCAHCGDSIENRNFFERQGKAYCESDYHDLFSPRCSYCNGPIKERCVTALGGKNFHVEHFVCAECGKTFGDGGFHEKSNSAYCRDCFYRTYAPKCQSCKQPITHKFITALNTHWHPECFCCQADDYFAGRCPMAVDIYDEIELDDH